MVASPSFLIELTALDQRLATCNEFILPGFMNVLQNVWSFKKPHMRSKFIIQLIQIEQNLLLDLEIV